MKQIGRYHLLRLLGEGAMGQVYLGLLRGAAGFEKEFAIKILRDEGSEPLQNTLISEGRIGGKLRHPNVVEVFELGREEGRFFLVMEYVDGLSLDQALVAMRPSPRACIELAIQMAQGLRHIHEQDSQQFVHSDIKPSNILLSRSGTVKVADLGLIRSSFEAVEKNRGTPGYMAPEHVRGEMIDQRADIFSLGLVLIEALVGERFFSGGTVLQLLSQVDHASLIFQERFQARLQDIHPKLSTLLQRMLEPDREKRIASMREVLDALHRLPELSGKGLFSHLEEEEIFTQRQPEEELSTREEKPQDVVLNQKKILGDIQTGLAETALLVIKGRSGQGKSRALRIVEDHVERSFFINAISARSLADILRLILQRLHAEASGKDPEEELARLFASWEKTILLMDNVDALDDEVWSGLRRLTRNATVQIIATSTTRISQQHVLVYELPVFSAKMSWMLFKTRVLERGFQFFQEDEQLWRSIIEKADGIPLVIELLVAQYCIDRTKVLSIDEVWKETSLERTLEEALARCTVTEQRALQRLAYFQAPFSLLSASQMLDTSISTTSQIIDSLHRSSLVSTHSVAFAREPYFKIPGGMKSLLRAKLSTEEKKEVDRHYVAVCSRWFDEENRADFPRYFAFQRSKIIALPDCLRAIEVADYLHASELLSKNTLAACQIFALVGPRKKGIELIQEYLEELSPQDPFFGLSRLWWGILLVKVGEESQAKGALEEALKSFEEQDDFERQQLAICYLIFALSGLKKHQTVLRYQEQFVKRPRDIATQALFYQSVGYFYTQRGDAKAIEYLQRAVSIFWSLGDNRQLVASLIAVGVIFFRQNRHQLAEKNYRKAIEIAERSQLEEGLESAWMNLALIFIMSNKISEAITLFSRSRERYQKLSNRTALGLLEANWAMLCLLEKDIRGVKLHLRRSAEQKVQNPIIVHTYRGVQGLVALEQGNFNKAIDNLQTARNLLREYSLSFKKSETLALLGEACLGAGQIKKAEILIAESAECKGQPLADFWHSLLLSTWCYNQGDRKRGDSHLLHMIRLVQQSQFPERPDLWLHIQRIRDRFGR